MADWDMSTTNLIDENDKFDFKYDISNPASYSVSKAIEGLNSGAIPWEHEYAIVYSNREKKYYLLAKRGRTCSLAALRDYAASH